MRLLALELAHIPTARSWLVDVAVIAWYRRRFDHEGPVELSEHSGNPIDFGWTSTLKHIAVVFTFEDDPELIIVRPITAYPVPEYGE